MGKMVSVLGIVAALLLGAAFVRAEERDVDPREMNPEKLVNHLKDRRPEVVEAFKAKCADWEKILLAGNEADARDPRFLKKRLEGLKMLTEVAREKGWSFITSNLEQRAREIDERLGNPEGLREGGEKGREMREKNREGGEKGREMRDKGREGGERGSEGGAREIGNNIERLMKEHAMAMRHNDGEGADRARREFGENLRRLVDMAEKGQGSAGRGERVDELRKQVDDLRKEMAEIRKLLGEVVK